MSFLKRVWKCVGAGDVDLVNGAGAHESQRDVYTALMGGSGCPALCAAGTTVTCIARWLKEEVFGHQGRIPS